MNTIRPGQTVGILGGGQLGRMLALAAAPLGLRTHVYCPDPDSPAFHVTNRATIAAYDDEASLEAFADSVDVVTYEFENVPAESAEILQRKVPVRPGPLALQTAQDRLAEKTFATAQGIATAPFAAVDGRIDFAAAIEACGLPAILKTRRLGYDGKGQRRIESEEDLGAAFEDLGEVPCILEAVVDFTRELSLLAARGRDGEVRAWPLIETRQLDHILDTAVAPAEVDAAVGEQALAIAETLLAGLDYVGVMAAELFLDSGDRLLMNEIAPRVHNSGHWTIEGSATSQFSQHIRAICGLSLGPVDQLGHCEMQNLLGDDIADWLALTKQAGVHVHHYGKTEIRPGRKMGHVTRIRRS